MSWSTRELAQMAGTTVNAVRHYHRSGLLDEPDRYVNGYKRYGVEDLVRLLQIRRLRDIGVPIADIRRIDSGVGTSPEVLEGIDAEMAASIERIRRARADLAEMVQNGTSTEVPPGFAHLSKRMSATEQSLTLIYTRVYDSDAMADVRQMIEADEDPATARFEALPADADEATRAAVAEEFAVTIARAIRDYPWMLDPEPKLTRSLSSTGAAMAATLHEIYNDAQLDVMERAGELARQLATVEDAPAP